MKWKKLGKIFDPTDHALPNGCVEFAQSPQALVCADFVRVYFATRQRDAIGKYVSHVAFVDFDRQLSRMLGVSKHTVIELGGLGCFDEHGIFPMSPVRDGNRVLAYTTGWNRKVSVPVDASIGLAISTDDGRTFQKFGVGPVLTTSLHEPFLIGDGLVALHGGTYHMWYIYGTVWAVPAPGEPPERVYKIGHATSADGVAWEKEGRQLVADKLGSSECQALPTVIHSGGRYHMFFCYRRQFGFRTDREGAYRIGYAFSDDLANWTRDDADAGIDVSPDGWDSDMQCYPNVFECDGNIYLLYNGNEFGRRGFGAAVLER
jgi:sucrose-6-phosphate hydrolase SacC (GH32 family)